MSKWLSTSHQRARQSAGPDRLPPRLGRSPSTSDPEPPPPPPGRTLRVLARVLLWTLIGLAVLRGLIPMWAAPGGSGSTGAAHSSSGGGGSRSQASAQSQLGMATAAAFLREYLTVDVAQSDRPGRLKRYLARGVGVDDGVHAQPGVSQSPDLVLPAGVRPIERGMEVTLVAHLLQTRDGTMRDGGTVAFVVPLATGSRGMAVTGIPRPATLPVDPSLTSRAPALPAVAARSAAVAAGQAVAAVLNGDHTALVRLGGGGAPAVRPFPAGWRPVGIAAIRPAGPSSTPSALVLVRARPTVAGIEYLVPVRVSLRLGAGAPTVREVDAGGTP
jgi:hypothetical protein